MATPLTADEHVPLHPEIVDRVSNLESTFTRNEADLAAAKHANHFIADLVKTEEMVVVIVEDGGAIPILSYCVQKLLPFEPSISWFSTAETRKGVDVLAEALDSRVLFTVEGRVWFSDLPDVYIAVFDPGGNCRRSPLTAALPTLRSPWTISLVPVLARRQWSNIRIMDLST